jgi:HlyD family secretion protein
MDNQMKRWLSILAVVAAALIIGAYLWLSNQPDPPKIVSDISEFLGRGSDEPEEFPSAVARRGTVRTEVSANGRVEPEARQELSFEMPGRVVRVLVEAGDTVLAGDPLARLDDEQLMIQVRQAEAALQSTETSLAEVVARARPEEQAAAEANLRAAQAQVEAATANLNQLEDGATYAQIAAAEAALTSAMADQKAAKDMHDLTMTCFTYYGQEYCPALGPFEEQARYSLAAADAAVTAAQARLYDLWSGADDAQIHAAEANIAAAAAMQDAAEAQRDLLLADTPEAQVASATSFIHQARVALELAKLALERATLVAPIDGVVAAVDITEGQFVGNGVTVITLIDTSRFHVTVEVDEADIADVSRGMTAEIHVDALPDLALNGRVERIAPSAGWSQLGALMPLGTGTTGAGAASLGAGLSAPGAVTYEMTILLDETDEALRTGMTASAVIQVGEVADVLLIPTWLVRTDWDTGQAYVMQPRGDEYARVDLQLGVRGNGVVQVLDGLEEGDVVVLIQESMIEAIMEARQ